VASELRFKRRVSGGAGAPATLKTAEPAYNMTDGKIYVGFGDGGSGNATSIKVIAQDNFIGNVPAGGGTGQALVKNSAADGDWGWGTISSGGTYTASGDGIELTGSNFALNYTEIATGLSLSSYATTSALTSGLAGKANTSHTHSAADITSGVFDIARIPVLPGNTTIVSSGGIANLTAPQQTAIESGTIVTTTDGRRWVYNTGTKTLEASYVELADTTPEWSVIANKPSFATVATSGAYADLTGKPSLSAVATSGAYADLSGRPTLGTMSSQNANAVAITGGTIDGVVIDGGTF
jgi:hypothetical protein